MSLKVWGLRAVGIVGDQARTTFLRLPPLVQRRALHLAGRYAPWEPGFDRHAPAVDAGLVTGPPDFVGVGTQKAGTSWWFDLITDHPDAYHQPGFHKERHFFTNLWPQGLAPGDVGEYHRWFPRQPGQVTGEWTPDYMHHHWVPQMLAVAAPQARLLVLLRDPVERFRSGLDHARQRGERLSPVVVSDAFTRGLYGMQLSRLEEVFSRRQVLVLSYESCLAAPERQLAITYAFIGVDDSYVPPELTRKVSSTKVEPLGLSTRVREELADLYREDLHLLSSIHPELDLDSWPSTRRLRQAVSR